jgi:signal peptidase I
MTIDNGSPWLLKRSAYDDSWRVAAPYTPPAADAPFQWQTTVPDRPRRRAVWIRRLQRAAVTVTVVAVTLFLFRSAFQGFRTDGLSMYPTLHPGERMLVSRLAYAQVDFGALDWLPLVDPGAHWSHPSRGDIIVFQSPLIHAHLVKRVIGTPGDHVQVANGEVIINGEVIDEPYANGPTDCIGECTWVVPEGQYFVMGDNRGGSRDSREGWFVPIETISGKSIITF